MELKKILYRKEMKLVTLLLTSMLIATASATVYFQLTMKATVTPTTAPIVKFKAGDDSGSSAANAIISTDGSWVRLAGLKAYSNVTLVYEEAVNISNTDINIQNIRLRHSSISPGPGWEVNNFTSITFKLINKTGGTVETYAYTVTGSGESATWNPPTSTTYYPVPATTEWSVRVEIVTKANASPSAVISIDMILDVQQ